MIAFFKFLTTTLRGRSALLFSGITTVALLQAAVNYRLLTDQRAQAGIETFRDHDKLERLLRLAAAQERLDGDIARLEKAVIESALGKGANDPGGGAAQIEDVAERAFGDIERTRSAAAALDRTELVEILKSVQRQFVDVSTIGKDASASFAQGVDAGGKSLSRFEEAAGALQRDIRRIGGAVEAASERGADVAGDGFGVLRENAPAGVLFGAALIAVMCLMGAVSMRRRVLNPLYGVTEAIQELAHGNTAFSLDVGDRVDAIGRLAKAFANLRQVILDHAADQHMIADANAAQARIVQLVGNGLERIAKKDLTYRMTEDFPDSYRRLQTDFNTAIGQLSEAIADVAASTQVIGAGMRETVAAADDLSRRTEQQAANLEETAAALAEITETVGQTAEGAEHARKIVSSTSSEAQKSGKVVRQAIEAMGDIDQSARKIGQIIGVIDSIATQTNLLALNAGVEAARAGEAGRGFAVVAAEIRDLARRCAKAAKEIECLISASNAQIGRGVALVGETGEALQRIVGQITGVNEVVAEIADRARQQAANLTEVNFAVGQMDQFTQQNAAMAEETTAVSHRLGEETKELIELVSRFRVDAHPAAMAADRPTPRRGAAPVSFAMAERPLSVGVWPSRGGKVLNDERRWIDF